MLLVDAGSVLADQQCLGGSSSTGTCVEGSNRIYGDSNQSLGNEMMKSDSAASNVSGQSASGLIQNGLLQNGQGGQGLGGSSGSGGLGSSLGKRSDPLQQNRFTSGNGPGSAQSNRFASPGQKNQRSSNGEAQSSSKNAMGESVDFFGDDAERDIHGSLVTCLKDSFGHHVCM